MCAASACSFFSSRFATLDVEVDFSKTVLSNSHSHRLQPGAEHRCETRKPFKTVSVIVLTGGTWLRPGVNKKPEFAPSFAHNHL